MLPILCLALVAEGPRLEAARGRVLCIDAESGARRLPSGAFEAPEAGVLEAGAASSVRVSIRGRMALELEGPSSFEWRAARHDLLRVAKARWDWRGSPGELGLPGGWSLRGGPGAYELQAQAEGYLLRNLAGAPIEVLEAGAPVLVVQPGAAGRFSPPRVQAAAPAAWEAHEWPWQAAAPAAEPRLWWPAAFACADVAPPRFHARTSEPIPLVVAQPPEDPPSPRPAPAEADGRVEEEPRRADGRWPSWLRSRVRGLFDGLHDRFEAARGWFARWRALHAFGVAFDPLAPFVVHIEDDRLELRLSSRAAGAERVRGTSVYLMQPGSAIVVARGGRLLSHAGEVEVRARAR
jgi:hypothetical protein